MRELRIGELEGAEEYTLGRIVGIAVGFDGAIFVGDGQGPIVRMYDANGKFVRVVGRSGSGPGEYVAIGGIASTPNGRIAIWDPGNGRISIFDAKGEYREAHAVPSTYRTDNSFAVDRFGNFYVQNIRRSGLASADPATYWLKVSSAGTVTDTIPIPLQNSTPTFTLETPGGSMRPFTRLTISTLSSQGYLVRGRNDRYAVDLLRPSGGVLRIERNYTPVKIGSTERSQWEAWANTFKEFAARERARAAASGGKMRVPESTGEYVIPSTKPPFRDLKTDEDGRIWVARYVEAHEVPQPARKPGDTRPVLTRREAETFDVFEPTGRFLGTVEFPMRTWLLAARGSSVYALTLGELDEQYVVRYRLQPSR